MNHPALAADGSTAAQGGGNEQPLHSRRLETTAAQGCGMGRRPLKTETINKQQQPNNHPQQHNPPHTNPGQPSSGWCDRQQGRRRRWDGRKKWGGTAPRFGGDSEEKTKPACGTPGWVESLAHLPPHTLNPQSPVGRSPLGNLPGPQTNKILLRSVRSEAGGGTNGHLHTNKQ